MENRIFIENFLKWVKRGKTNINKNQLIDPEHRDTKIGMKRMASIINDYYSKNPYFFQDEEKTVYYDFEDGYKFVPNGFKVRDIDALVGCKLRESKREIYTGGHYETIVYYRILPVRESKRIKI